MALDDNDLDPSGGPADSEGGAAPRHADEPAVDTAHDAGGDAGGERRAGRFSRRGLLVFLVSAVVLAVAAVVVFVIVMRQQKEAASCDKAFETNDPDQLRRCWTTATQKIRLPLVLYRIAKHDQIGNLDIVTQALGGSDWRLVMEAANSILYMAQSERPEVRAKIAELKDSVIKKRMAELKSVDVDEARKARGLLALALVFQEDVDGLETALTDAGRMGFEAFFEPMFGYLANKDQRFFDGVMKLAEAGDPALVGRILSILSDVDYSGSGPTVENRRRVVIALLQKVLAGQPDPDTEIKAIMCWAETGDESALRRVAEYFDRAALLENAESETARQSGQELMIRAEQIFEKVKTRYGAEKLVDLYHLIQKNKFRKERILYYVRELHDPRAKVRDFLVELVEAYSPPNGDFAEYFTEDDVLSHSGLTYTNAVFALSELLDERAIPHLKIILNKFSTMVSITDLEANLYNAGLLILGAIAVHLGGETEERLARYILEISDPDKYPERWMEKRAGKMRVLSFIAADMWKRFLAERRECDNDWDPVTTLPKVGTGCPSAVDLHAELAVAFPAPAEGTAPAEGGAAAVAAAPAGASQYEELPEMQARRERERLFTIGEKTLDDTKHEEIRWVLDWPALDTKQRVYYFIKLFACPIEITMVSAMMDRNDQRVKHYERWCGDYGAAAESLARLAHDASLSFRKEARQFLADRLDKGFLKYPGTQEPVQYNQNMNQEIYNFVMYRQAVAKALGYLGAPEDKLIEALKKVVFDELDHPQVGRYAGVSLGIVADAATLDEIVGGFVSSDTHPDVRAYLLKALDGHFRFAPLNDRAPRVADADSRAIERLMTFASDYSGGIEDLPANRLYLLGVLFGAVANNPAIGTRLAELVKGDDSRIREVALLALECSSVADSARPIFAGVFGREAPTGPIAELRSLTTLKTLRNVFLNVGAGSDPYTIPVRSALEIEDETLFRRLEVLHALQELGQREFLDYYVMRVTLALGTDKDAYDKALADAGLEAAEKYTPIAYKLSFRDNFTYYETPYLTWIDRLFAYASDSSKNLLFRKYAVELLWRIGEKGYVYTAYSTAGAEGASAADRELRNHVYGTVMRMP